MNNIVALISVLFFLTFASSALAGPDKNEKKTPDAIELKFGSDGRKLTLPPSPGFIIDDECPTPSYLKGMVVILTPAGAKVDWAPHRLGLSLDDLGEHIWVNASDGQSRSRNHRKDSLQSRVDEWSSNSSKNRVVFGDIADSYFWYSEEPKPRRLTIYAYTILDDQLVIMTFGRVPEETPATKEWLEAQQQEVVDWVRQLRATNK